MKLSETIDFIDDSGIFRLIALTNTFEWLSVNDAQLLDMEYYLNHSGDKTISPMYNKLLILKDKGKIDNALNLIKSSIILKFKDKWNKLYSAFIESTYNPLENYSMVEDEKQATKVSTTGKSLTGTYGFNSEKSVPSGDSEAISTVEGDLDDNHRKLSRSGNIGVTTSQQMLESEINLRKWNLYNEMMSDVDTIMTLSIYS